MHAAVVTAFDTPPQYRDHPDPVARDADEVVVEVLAAGLHPRVRSQASGSHYTSTDELPLVPGIDGVVRDPKGRIRYTVLDDTVLGTMAERTVIDNGRSVVLPEGIGPVQIAAAMNPVMSSWVALRRRIDFGRRQRVLVLGATGNAGRMAIQVAKRFGAAQVIAAGRDTARLAELRTLGADETCTFDELVLAADVDVVIDYVWGEPTARAMVDMLTARADRSAPLTWIEIGSVAGPTAPIPSRRCARRDCRSSVPASAQSPVATSSRNSPSWYPPSPRAILTSRPAVPLAEVEHVWTATVGMSDRIVLVP
ncbi:zinc-binding dehydrogenase [Streptomyces hokutonensis]|uniref:zinc-binding dehydrogenase n=1 Tax=Streptomyces hokutonensis TaxID=1306990 RepID=UPI0036B01E8F